MRLVVKCSWVFIKPRQRQPSPLKAVATAAVTAATKNLDGESNKDGGRSDRSDSRCGSGGGSGGGGGGRSKGNVLSGKDGSRPDGSGIHDSSIHVGSSSGGSGDGSCKIGVEG